MEESIPTQAASSYHKINEGYKSRLRSNPDLKLSECCKESHTNYCGEKLTPEAYRNLLPDRWTKE